MSSSGPMHPQMSLPPLETSYFGNSQFWRPSDIYFGQYIVSDVSGNSEERGNITSQILTVHGEQTAISFFLLEKLIINSIYILRINNIYKKTIIF